MGRLRAGQIPAMRPHKASNRWVVTLSREDFYLGPLDGPASEAERERDRQVGLWLARGRRPRPREGERGILVAALADRYVREFAAPYYRKNGEPTSRFRGVATAMDRLSTLFGPMPAAEFTTDELKAFRASYVREGRSRGTVNDRTRQVVQAFRWAAQERLVPGSVHVDLKTLIPLRKGRGEAPDPEPIGPASPASIEAAQRGRHGPTTEILRVMLLTGMRPGEACGMRAGEIDRSGPVWVYRPGSHKTEHHGKGRAIPIGPRAQAILAPRIDRARGPELYLFPSGKSAFGVTSLRRTIQRRCVRAGVEPFAPNQLRHSSLTEIGRRMGLDAARAVAGHSEASTTVIYAEREAEDLRRAVRVAEEMG